VSRSTFAYRDKRPRGDVPPSKDKPRPSTAAEEDALAAESARRRAAGEHPDPRVHFARPFAGQLRRVGSAVYYVGQDGAFRRLAPEDLLKLREREVVP